MVLLIICASLILVSCGAPVHQNPITNQPYDSEKGSNGIIENEFMDVVKEPTSNMSLNANGASYTMIRNSIQKHAYIDPHSVRIEEMLNYFRYNYQKPRNEDVFGVQSYVMPTPWNKETSLLFVSMQASDIKKSDIQNNLVFLIDVSGSMASYDKLPLIKQSFGLLLEQLGPNDRISVVTYASRDRIIIDGAKGDSTLAIESAIQNLYATGATGASEGIQTAYDLAQKHFIENGNNRVIIATDGDFNVGITKTKDLESFISEKKETGIYLSVLGFGIENRRDSKLESLAKHGNGQHVYIDSLIEAKKALMTELNATLYTVARDAKAQIDFTDSKVKYYRLIGYENRRLTNEQFNDDKTDAGEIGLGHQITICYEIMYDENKLKYDYGNMTIRYKDPDIANEAVLEQMHPIQINEVNEEDYQFMSTLIEFGLILRNSKFKKDASLESIITRLESLTSITKDVYKLEFLELVNKYTKRINIRNHN